MAGRDVPSVRAASRHQRGALRCGAGLLAMAALLTAAAVVVAGEAGWVPGVGQHGDNPATAGAVPPQRGPRLMLRPPPPAAAVLEATDGGQPVSFPAVRRRLAKALALPGLRGHVGLAVSQLGALNGGLHMGAARVTPASTLKLLTTTAALASLGPQHRFKTSVVDGRTAGSIVLVGGGDPTLTDASLTPAAAAKAYPPSASLQRLAGAAADRLSRQGIRRVHLGYDASLFTGPAVNPRWPPTYVPQDVVSPISALWVDEGRTDPGADARSLDPAREAAVAFRARLVAAGVTVTGQVTAQAAPRAAPSLAAVVSAPLDQIVEHILEASDNEGAEVLLRQVALADGRPGSSVAGVGAVRRALEGVGVSMSGAVFYDGSGLSRKDVLPVRLVLDVLETAASPDHPSLRPVVSGLAVAGFSGSLGYRFDRGGDAREGLGYVRAKTGTLTGVHALAGLAVTRTGQVLAFVAVADAVPLALTLDARSDLDDLAAALTTCGC